MAELELGNGYVLERDRYNWTLLRRVKRKASDRSKKRTAGEAYDSKTTLGYYQTLRGVSIALSLRVGAESAARTVAELERTFEEFQSALLAAISKGTGSELPPEEKAPEEPARAPEKAGTKVPKKKSWTVTGRTPSEPEIQNVKPIRRERF